MSGHQVSGGCWGRYSSNLATNRGTGSPPSSGEAPQVSSRKMANSTIQSSKSRIAICWEEPLRKKDESWDSNYTVCNCSTCSCTSGIPNISNQQAIQICHWCHTLQVYAALTCGPLPIRHSLPRSLIDGDVFFKSTSNTDWPGGSRRRSGINFCTSFLRIRWNQGFLVHQEISNVKHHQTRCIYLYNYIYMLHISLLYFTYYFTIYTVLDSLTAHICPNQISAAEIVGEPIPSLSCPTCLSGIEEFEP